MKKIIILSIVSCLSTLGYAQLNLQYQYSQQALPSHNMTTMDATTDNNGNCYLLYSDDPSKILLLDMIDASGGLVWRDTVALAGFGLVDVTKGKLAFANNFVYASGVFYNSANTQAANGVIKYNASTGAKMNEFIDAFGVWSGATYGIYPSSTGDVYYLYSYGDYFTPNPIMHISKLNSAMVAQWTKSYAMSKLAYYVTATTDASDNFYMAYALDSINATAHNPYSYVRKLLPNGNQSWVDTQANTNYLQMKKLNNGDIVCAGMLYTGAGVPSSNWNGNIVTTKINSMTGVHTWNTVYNGSLASFDNVTEVGIDAADNVYVGAGFTNYATSGVIKYNSNGVQQWLRNWGISTSVTGVKTMSTGEVNCVFANPVSSISLNNFWIHKMNAAMSSSIDSIANNQSPQYIGIAMTRSNVNDELFIVYSEGHCGANHVNVIKYCPKVICTPNAVNDVETVSDFQLYPNPAVDYISIKSSMDLKNAQIEILDMTGKLVLVKYHNISSPINISLMNKGVYFLKITNEGKTFVLKFVKE